MRKPLIILIAWLSSISFYGQATLASAALATSVANRLMAETLYTFKNRQTGEVYTHLKNIPVTDDIRVVSQYNDWHYTNGVLNIALLELADLTGNNTYEEYVFKNMDFVFDPDNLGFFEKQYREVFKKEG